MCRGCADVPSIPACDQKHDAGVMTFRNGQHRAVLGEHGVQRDHRITVGPGQLAEIRLVGEAGEPRHGRRQIGAQRAPGEHQRGARGIGQHDAGAMPEAPNDIPPSGCNVVYFQASDAPAARGARQTQGAERVGGGGTQRRIAGQAAERRLVARQEPRRAGSEIAFTRPPPASRRSRSFPVPSPVPAHRCARCGRRRARARGSAPDDPAGADGA